MKVAISIPAVSFFSRLISWGEKIELSGFILYHIMHMKEEVK